MTALERLRTGSLPLAMVAVVALGGAACRRGSDGGECDCATDGLCCLRCGERVVDCWADDEPEEPEGRGEADGRPEEGEPPVDAEPRCVADGWCDGDCSPGVDPDCAPPCGSDSWCNPGCSSGADPDCGPGCDLDGTCNPDCPGGSDPDCESDCGADTFCNPDCPAGGDPDCVCGALGEACCPGDECASDLICTGYEGEAFRCHRSCTLRDCSYGGDEGYCFGIDSGYGICLPYEGDVAPAGCDADGCETTYGATWDTTCVGTAVDDETYCLEGCDPAPTPCLSLERCVPVTVGLGACVVPAGT